MRKSSFVRRAGSALAVGAMVMTGVMASASSASAVGSSACSNNFKDRKVAVTDTANFRTGPGKSYTSKGLVHKGDNKLLAYCERGNWVYGKVLKGPHKGKKGWISWDVIGWPMNPPGQIPGR